MTPLLEVENLRVAFPATAATSHPVDGVSFSLARGELLAVVGESGCGKSLTALSLLRLVPPPGQILPGSALRLDGADLLALGPSEMRAVRGRRIGMIFQDPMTSLNPVFTVADQISESVRAHTRVSKQDARARALSLLQEVGIPDPEERLDSYPHQLSGGMRQRVMIAIALASEPELLIADEPTTALDVTVQAQILELLDRLRAARGMAILLITHDLGIVAGRADRVAVMYAGRLVEEATTAELFAHPSHPYTRGLLASVPRISGPVTRLTPIAGTVPPPTAWPAGCRFHPRCPAVLPRCPTDDPPALAVSGATHRMRCWLAEARRP
ncbi:MAG TPA: ABC transporter ATP-binding protein [Gemmatimonadales bacterium]|nr:ABC transporter ATP-binding protein [Gemmatimonadales bacterium]